jgi:hypothetical protein
LSCSLRYTVLHAVDLFVFFFSSSLAFVTQKKKNLPISEWK